MAFHTCFTVFKSMGVVNKKMFVQKAVMCVSANILRPIKQKKNSNVVMLT